MMMMMSFICSCRNKNQPNVICPSKGTSPLPSRVWWAGVFILGLNLGGVGPVRGLRWGGRGGGCEEWARSG